MEFKNASLQARFLTRIDSMQTFLDVMADTETTREIAKQIEQLEATIYKLTDADIDRHQQSTIFVKEI